MSFLTIIVKSSHDMMARWWWCIVDAILMYNLQARDGSGPWIISSLKLPNWCQILWSRKCYWIALFCM